MSNDNNNMGDDNNSMGWWKPYFYSNVSGIQILFRGLQIDSDRPLTIFLALSFIFALCLIDRTVAARTESTRGTSSYIPYYFLQRLSGGLVMLVLMSFNAVLFGVTIVFLSVCEFIVGRWCGVRGGRGGENDSKPPEPIGTGEATGFKTYEMVGTMD